MARIPAGTRSEAARAVDVGAAAFPAWAELPPAETGCAAGFAGFQVLTPPGGRWSTRSRSATRWC
jgi:hypothetical protein